MVLPNLWISAVVIHGYNIDHISYNEEKALQGKGFEN